MIYWELFITFLKIGLFAFGGGYGMIPLIREEVLNHGWLTEATLFDLIGISESTPGPIAINMATFVGSTQAGFWGGLIASIAVILPIFIIMLFIIKLLEAFRNNNVIKALFDGIKPVVIGLIIATGIYLIYQNIYCNNDQIKIDYLGIILFVILFCLYFVYKKLFKKAIPPIILIVISGILGIIFYSF